MVEIALNGFHGPIPEVTWYFLHEAEDSSSL
jgi:hypothetical protein